jgi:hypothetical protein
VNNVSTPIILKAKEPIAKTTSDTSANAENKISEDPPNSYY